MLPPMLTVVCLRAHLKHSRLKTILLWMVGCLVLEPLHLVLTQKPETLTAVGAHEIV